MVRRERLYSDTDAIAVRRNHPDAGRVGDMETFTPLGHVAVIGYGEQEDLVDTWLAENGVTRRIELVAPKLPPGFAFGDADRPHRRRAAPPDRGADQ